MGATETVELVWDWRLARVYDGVNQIVDECLWGGEKPVSSVVKRLKSLKLGRMTEEARILFERFPDAISVPVTSVEDWPELSPTEYELLQKSSRILAEQEIIEVASEPDYRLEHLVRAMDESRNSANNLESQLVEWIGMLFPSLDINQRRTSIATLVMNSSDTEELSKQLDCETCVEIEPHEWRSLHSLSEQIVLANSAVDTIEKSTEKIAHSHFPSLSKILGPSIAAKLCVAAHGRTRLARLPASTIQVLGAEKSFFSHLQKGTKPPKHGFIFQHTWVSRSHKSARGAIARMLASKAAIAVRLDCYGGEPLGNKDLSEIEQKVSQIRIERKGR